MSICCLDFLFFLDCHSICIHDIFGLTCFEQIEEMEGFLLYLFFMSYTVPAQFSVSINLLPTFCRPPASSA